MSNDRQRIAELEELACDQMIKLSEACARNSSMAAELSAIRQSRNAADDKCTRLSAELAEQISAKERYAGENKILLEKFSGSGIARIVSELAAMTQERDALRREVEALVGLIVRHVECTNCPRCEDVCGKNCGESIRDWAKRQAAQAGKAR